MTFLAVVSIKAPGIKQSFQVMPQQNQQRNEIKKLHSAIHVESGLIASQIIHHPSGESLSGSCSPWSHSPWGWRSPEVDHPLMCGEVDVHIKSYTLLILSLHHTFRRGRYSIEVLHLLGSNWDKIREICKNWDICMRNGKRNCINPLPTPFLQYCMLYTKVELFSEVYSSWKTLDSRLCNCSTYPHMTRRSLRPRRHHRTSTSHGWSGEKVGSFLEMTMLQKTMQRTCYGYADMLRNPVCRGAHFEMLVKSSTGPETSWPTDLNLHVCASHRFSAKALRYVLEYWLAACLYWRLDSIGNVHLAGGRDSWCIQEPNGS